MRIRMILEKHYGWIAGAVSLLVLALNYHATAMQGIIPYYQDFARIIAAGFDPSAGTLGTPTFPIWGYGWVYLIFRSKLAILLVQQVLGVTAFVLLASELGRSSLLPAGTARAFKLLLIVSIPLFALNSVLWPYSFAASFLALSAVFMLRATKSDQLRPLMNWAVSALFFGLMLNFRSDFILFPVLVPILAVIVRMKRNALVGSLVWVGCVYLMLLPWALYAKHATGHAVLTSTNSGHVLFVGLGQLPGNKWGITADDGDPVMLATVNAALGSGASTLSYEGSRVLRDAAIARVVESPGEYGKKVLHGVKLTLTQGFYPGSFYETKACLPDCYPEYKSAIAGLRGGPSAKDSRVPAWRAAAQVAAVGYSRALLMLCFAAAPFAVVWGWKKRSFPLAFASAAVLYQAGITIFTSHLPGYTSSVYLFHLLLLSSCIGRFVIARTEPTGHL